MTVTLNGRPHAIQAGERLIDLINRIGIEVPHVCYHPQLGPIQSCDTCMVEVDGKLMRACGTMAAEDMNVVTSSPRADAAQREAFDRILGNHLLYCTVCYNNNGNCTIHNTTKLLAVEHQEIPYKPKPYEVDMFNPFKWVSEVHSCFLRASTRGLAEMESRHWGCWVVDYRREVQN